MTLPQFTFIHKTKFMAGKIALEQLPSELDQRQCRTALIVTDARSVQHGAVKALGGAFGRCDTRLLVFDRTREVVDDAQVQEVADIFRDTGADALVAVGGPSAVNTARLANLDVSLGFRDAGRLKDTRDEYVAMKPLFVIPTHATTETGLSTPLDMLGGSGRKALTAFMPTAVILDPRAMVPPSAKEMAEAGLAALFHAVEASTGPCRNPVSQSFAFSALTLLKASLIRAFEKKPDKKTYLHVTSAVHLADAAFSNASCGLGVSLIRALHRIRGIDANAAAATLLPVLMNKRMQTREPDVARLLWALEGPEAYARTPAHRRAQAAIDSVKTLMVTTGRAGAVNTDLGASGIINQSMGEIIQCVTGDSDSLTADHVQPEEVHAMLAS